jgi:hypothetical protein
MRAVRGRYGAPNGTKQLATLPDDVLHLIFSKLEFRAKISCGLVCTQWDQLLKAGGGAGKHWVVAYDVDSLALRAPSRWPSRQSGESLLAATERCVSALHLFT